ncbi:hypothetical protein [Jatrophihabitans sp.]|uniref:hypothetical protein n=1 Tax=Jatrophihabitans sp. TaxID=1932789 RepID=UPI0030C6E902
MSNPTVCPRGNAWCTEHSDHVDQCVSAALPPDSASCAWVIQEIPGTEPMIVVDGSRPLSIDEASQLVAAIRTLTTAIRADEPVAP